MSVLGPVHHNDNLHAYYNATRRLHWFITGTISLLLFIGALILHFINSSLTLPLIGSALATPFILLFWLFRRNCYIQTQPERALMGSALYAGTTFLGILSLKIFNLVSTLNAFIVITLASVGASILLQKLLRNPNKSSSGNNSILRRILPQHWEYGKWVVGSAFVSWLLGSIYIPMVGILLGLEESGGFRAMNIFLFPLDRSIAAFGLLLLPWAAKLRREQGRIRLRSFALVFSAVSTIIAIIYVLMITIFAEQLITMLYDKPYYLELAGLVPIFGAVSLFTAMSSGFSIAVRATENPKAILISQSTGAAFTLILGIIAVKHFGINGAAMTQALSAFAALVVLVILWNRIFNNNRNEKEDVSLNKRDKAYLID